MQFTDRSFITALPLALVLAAGAVSTASAQVATLVAPEDSPEPDVASAEEQFEFADRQEAILVFAQCMRDNGIDMDDPQPGQGGGGRFLRPRGSGFDQFGEEFGAAQQACAPILAAARPELDPEAELERLEEQLLVAQCLRDSGYEQFPDPTIGADGRLQRIGGRQFVDLGIDFRSTAFQSARLSCATELGVDLGRGGPGRAPGGVN